MKGITAKEQQNPNKASVTGRDRPAIGMNQSLVLSQQVKQLSASLHDLDRALKVWPSLPVSDEPLAPVSAPSHLTDYAAVFDVYSTLLNCPGSLNAYERLKQLRECAQAGRKALAELVKNKQAHGPELILQESLKLKELLLELHKFENTFVGIVQQEFHVVLDALVGTMNAQSTA